MLTPPYAHLRPTPLTPLSPPISLASFARSRPTPVDPRAQLDSFEVPQEYAEARKGRKAGVRRVQALLDRTDAAKQAVKGLL